ncbi:MAG: preprotein translocase subunit SecG [Clostridiales bacterium]|nr:preprotein translocase subunit SecG [Clostridiales bacterium]MDD7347390.1 preprotein translocase subunit SecG [Clostridiales bacterium]MDY4060714.1 preprotein translocase subunit SecG [Anaerovoracaceae bacterium]
MNTALMILLAIASIILIISVLLQSSKSDGLSGSIAGGAEQLFGKRKSRGYEAVLEKITVVAAVCFIVLSIVLVAISK